MISGLHSCKPGNEPQVGQVKTFVVINNPATETKKAWTKIKSASIEEGGRSFRITSVKPTGFTDKYNNVSSNLEIEPTDGIVMQSSSPPPPKTFTPTQRDTARQYLMRSANLMRLCMNAAKAVFEKDYERELAISLFIDASRQGYIAEMDAKPMKADRSVQDPEITPSEEVREGMPDEPF